MSEIMEVPFPRAAWRFLISFFTLNISILSVQCVEDETREWDEKKR